MRYVLAALMLTAMMMGCGKVGDTGPTGPQGQAGAPGQKFEMELIDPCGPNPNGTDEVLAKLPDGRILQSFTRYNGTFLNVAQPGRYMTVDGQHCTYTIGTDGRISW